MSTQPCREKQVPTSPTRQLCCLKVAAPFLLRFFCLAFWSTEILKAQTSQASVTWKEMKTQKQCISFIYQNFENSAFPGRVR